jgi:hypothetical protein
MTIISTTCRRCGTEFEPGREVIRAGAWRTCPRCQSHGDSRSTAPARTEPPAPGPKVSPLSPRREVRPPPPRDMPRPAAPERKEPA